MACTTHVISLGCVELLCDRSTGSVACVLTLYSSASAPVWRTVLLRAAAGKYGICCSWLHRQQVPCATDTTPLFEKLLMSVSTAVNCLYAVHMAQGEGNGDADKELAVNGAPWHSATAVVAILMSIVAQPGVLLQPAFRALFTVFVHVQTWLTFRCLEISAVSRRRDGRNRGTAYAEI